jgi:hypothetical protein
MKKIYTYLFLFILCCGNVNLFAQTRDTRITIGTNYGTINDNKKELADIKKEQGEIKASQENTRLALERIEQRMATTDSIYGNNIAKRDLENLVLRRERDSLNNELRKLNDAKTVKNQRIAELENAIQIHKKGNFLPFGIKQIKNEPKALGYTFLVSEIAVPIALGVGFECAANWNYKQHKNQQAQNLTDHKDYYKKYENYHNAAIWTPIVSFVGIYAINVLCNYYCTNIEVKSQKKNGLINKIEIKPQTFIDLQGNLGMGMSIGLKL